MQEALKLLNRLKDAPVLCVGDIMLDRYIYGQATRISPEAPVPVVRVKKRLIMPGGVGNVVKNIGALGALPRTVSLTGNDLRREQLRQLLTEAGLPEPDFIIDEARPTSIKTRIIAGIQQVVRYDEEDERPVSGQAAERLIETIRR
ncbi:MAG: PfkB family carbohydrate kinase, partial [Candidatus Adiutrix sp.]|nr:PfkB family carbohydrate kinase [Candidatus Adiutrix sp.]